MADIKLARLKRLRETHKVPSRLALIRYMIRNYVNQGLDSRALAEYATNHPAEITFLAEVNRGEGFTLHMHRQREMSVSALAAMIIKELTGIDEKEFADIWLLDQDANRGQLNGLLHPDEPPARVIPFNRTK